MEHLFCAYIFFTIEYKNTSLLTIDENQTQIENKRESFALPWGVRRILQVQQTHFIRLRS